MNCFLIIAGNSEAKLAYELTKVTMIVESIHDIEKIMLQQGAVVLEEIKKVPTGWNMRIQHPDGLIAEYVEHRKEIASP